MTKVFDKTEKGREEIATRKYHLSSRARSLLVMVDGKQRADELLKKVAGLGLTEQCMTDLVQEGFIREAASMAVASAGAASASMLPEANSTSSGSTQNLTLSVTVAATNAATAAVLPPGQTQFEAIYRFYNETIKSTIGLRGYGLQLKVEKAASIDDFRRLKKPYLEAVLKAQGEEMARSLRDRLDHLLYLGEPIPEMTTVAGLHN